MRTHRLFYILICTILLGGIIFAVVRKGERPRLARDGSGTSLLQEPDRKSRR